MNNVPNIGSGWTFPPKAMPNEYKKTVLCHLTSRITSMGNVTYIHGQEEIRHNLSCNIFSLMSLLFICCSFVVHLLFICAFLIFTLDLRVICV